MVEGSDSTLKSEYIVIGGHMDHLGMGGPFSLAKDHAKAIHHGADDNASGAIGVVQLATYFGSLPANQRPKRSLIFICFSGEELGLLGSDFYVKHPIIPLAQTPAMLNMDMIGRMVGTKLTIIGTGTATEWNPLLDNLNKSSSFEISRSENGFGGSDHQSFYNAGLPVLFFFTNLHADYHTPTDTIEKINTEGEARVLTLVANATRRIADMPSRPTFQKLKVVENSGGARGFRVYFGSIPDYAAQVEGVQLSGVREGSPAATAGLQTGDILIRFAGKSIRGVEDYSIALGENKPGDVVEVVFIRAGKKMTVKVTLAARK